MNWHYLYIFLQVDLLEIAVLLFVFRRHMSAKKTVMFVTLANAITHPLVFFVRSQLPLTLLSAILIAEVFALVTEALIYQKVLRLPARTAWWGSTLANLVSWQVGPILTALVFLRDRL